MDPAVAFDSISLTAAPQSLETLYQYQFTTRPVKVVPLLADGMPSFSNEGRTVRIKIKKGILFQDDPAFAGGKGREVKAADFIYGWKRLSLPILKSPGHFIFEGKVKDYEKFRESVVKAPKEKREEKLKETFAGFHAVDDYTIEINLQVPYPQLLHILTMTFTAPMAHEVPEKYGQDNLHRKVVGTGPFRLVSYQSGSKLIFERNPTYRGDLFPSELDEYAKEIGMDKYVGKKMPFVDRIEFPIYTEQQPMFLNFKKGVLDAAAAIPKDSFDGVITEGEKLGGELQKKQIVLQKTPEPVLWYLNFNAQDELVGKNKYLRAAILHAIDREKMIALFTNKRGIKASSMVPFSVPGHIKRDTIPNDFDLAKAKRFMTKAGYPEGKGLPTINYDLRGASTLSLQMAQYIAKSVKEIGVNLNIITNTFPGYLEKQKLGNLQFFMDGWAADYPDAENFMQLMYSKNVSPGPNAANWKNAEYDKLYIKIAQSYPGPERDELIKQAEKVVFDDYAWGLLWSRVNWNLSHAWFKNYRPSELIRNDFKYFDIDEAQRDKLKKEVF